MEVIHTQAASLPPAPPAFAPPAQGRVPSLWSAAGLIATYFVLQVAASTLTVLAISVTTAFQHGWQGLDHAIPATLEQPAMQALLATLSLGIAAPLTLLLARWKWPRLWSRTQPPGFGVAWPRRRLFFGLAVAVGLTAPWLGALLTQLLAHGHAVTQGIQQLGSSTPPELRIPLVLVVVSVGPLAEELLFRGVLLSALLQRWHVGWSVVISSLVFALIHLPGLQFQWYALPDLALLALALTWLRLRSGSIWPAVLAHGLNNLVGVAGWFVALNLPG
ncbi:CPBP family intramembrane metalloprotease [Rhodanobacter glycinis]|uniref:CPBP family intramembrane metalloprotease n=1 Tax=Rhodanobacter glycinis TaxID=582702 RepID=A0A502FNT1_9GAMM|nr:CPBP family intramembrane metalloprotease [Rhodanobacter glycinis]TPG51188.1 CPBP family intramembrane metalloprotease [Rhodanobacter glycinis]